jgi:hypothetical protein
MNKFIVIALAGAGVMLAGCGSVSEVTKERVAHSESIVQQSQQTVGNAEAGALDIQRARELLGSAHRQLDEKNGVAAERFAQQAQLTAELAVAKTQSAQARKAADELTASIETLRQEANR